MKVDLLDINFLVPPMVLIALIVVILSLKVVYVCKTRDWFVLGMGAPLLYILWLYVQELYWEGSLDKPTARFSVAILLTVLLLNMVYRIAKLFIIGGRR